MATNGALRAALLTKLGVTRQALSQRVQQKKKLMMMSTENAVYLIAHDEGLKLDKYLSPAQLDAVQGLHARLSSARAPLPPTRATARRAPPGPRQIRFPGEYRVTDSLLPPGKLNEAMAMSALYPLLYVLENSMREVIRRVMMNKYGDSWWDTEMTSVKLKEIATKAAGRKANEKRWHQGRGSTQIDYVDIEDLGTIISGKQSDFHPAIVDDMEWFRSFMKEVAQSRNVVCHMNPLEDHNADSLRVNLTRWQKLVEKAGAAVPSAGALNGP